MTLILALACKEGVLIASDGQVTYETVGQPVKGLAEKLYSPWNNVAWGGSGHVGLIQLADEELRRTHPQANKFEKYDRARLRAGLGKDVASVIRPQLTDRYLPLPGTTPPHTSFLFVALAADGPCIFEVGANLLDVSHTATGYAAIGSGEIFPYFALASLAHYKVADRTMSEARLIAYRVVDDAINVAAQGLGPPIQMIEIAHPTAPDAAKAHRLENAELDMLADQVVSWKALERETLGALGGQPGLVPDP